VKPRYWLAAVVACGVLSTSGQARPLQLPPLLGDTGCRWGAAACNPAVRGLEAQFPTLRDHGDLLGFRMDGAADVDMDHHWQGIQRLMPGAGRYAVVSRSGRGISFVVVRLGSRGADGERLRSNRIGPRSSAVAPPAADGIVAWRASDTGFDHSGGVQTVGRYLAVGLEEGARSRVVFWNLSTPASPRRVGAVEHATGVKGAGTVSLARLRGGRYLLIVGGTDAQILDFYVSRTSSLVPPRFDFATRWRAGQLRTRIPPDRTFGAYQSLSLVADTSGRLYLVGTNRSGSEGDFVDLFLLDNSGNTVAITKLAKRRVYCRDPAGVRQCDLRAAGGVHVTPSRRLLVYATEHANNGPLDTVKAVELRTVPHRDTCSAVGQAWVELYDDSGFDGDRSVMLDYADRALRPTTNYDDVEGFEDKTSAAWWCLPRGWRHRLYADKSPCGGRTVDLVGTGVPQSDPNLDDSSGPVRGFGDEVSCSAWIAP
jgi:hypothetical protein